MTMGLGYSKIVGLFSVGTLLVFVIFLPPFTLYWHVEGAALGMLVSVVPGLLLILYETRNVFKMNPIDYIRASLGIHFLPLVILIGAALLNVLPIVGIGSKLNLVMCCCLGAIYLGVIIASKWLPVQSYITRFLK